MKLKPKILCKYSKFKKCYVAEFGYSELPISTGNYISLHAYGNTKDLALEALYYLIADHLIDAKVFKLQMKRFLNKS